MSELWKDHPPFYPTLVRGVSDDQEVTILESCPTVDDALLALKPYRHGTALTFIRNALGFSTFPIKVTPPPPPRK